MSITELLLQATEKKSQELFLAVGYAPKIKLGLSWTDMRSQELLLSEWKILTQTILSLQQKEALDKFGFIKVETQLSGSRLLIEIHEKSAYLKAHFYFIDNFISESDFLVPNTLMETVVKQNGIFLFTGQEQDSVDFFILKVLEKIATQKNNLGLIVSDEHLPKLQVSQSAFFMTSWQDHQDCLRDSQWIWAHGVHTLDQVKDCLEYAESGKTILLSLKSSSIFAAIRKMYSFLENISSHHAIPRFAEVLQMVVRQKAIPGILTEMVFAHEILGINSKIRSLLEKAELVDLQKILQDNVENPNYLHLNQSLLQLLIRRKIQVKEAFAASPDPESLDQLLKKVGI